MKITKNQLKAIIMEELQKLDEAHGEPEIKIPTKEGDAYISYGSEERNENVSYALAVRIHGKVYDRFENPEDFKKVIGKLFGQTVEQFEDDTLTNAFKQEDESGWDEYAADRASDRD